MHVNVVICALTGLGRVGLPRPAPLPDALLQIISITAEATSRGKMMHVMRGDMVRMSTSPNRGLEGLPRPAGPLL